MSQVVPALTGLILAGGLGARLGGMDKGLLVVRGRPLIEHVLEALRPQAERLLISANRHPERYAAYGYPVLPDLRPDYPGPLAGLEAGLAAVDTPWLLYAPCDASALPADLASCLMQRQAETGAEVVVVENADGLVPVCGLVAVQLLPDLSYFLDQGGRKTGEWLRSRKMATMDYRHWPETAWSMNTPAELAALEQTPQAA